MGNAAIPIYRPVVSLLCFLLCASIARAEIQLEVSPGFDGHVRPGSWTPLTLRLSGITRAANGRLQVFVRTRESTRTYGQSVLLPGGALSLQQTLYYIPPYSDGTTQVTAQVLIDGRVAAERDVAGALPLRDEQAAIVALTQDKGGYTQMNSLRLPETRRFLTSSHRQYQRASYSGANLNQTHPLPRVLYPRSSALPDLPGGYAGVDVVVLGDMPLDTLTEQQWQALVGWVHEGGLLVISGGADLNRLRSRLLVDLLPVTPTGVRQVSALPALNRRYGAPVQTVSTAIVEGALTPGAAALCRQESVPLVAAKPFGSGMVVFTAFDLAAPEFRLWPGQQNLWREIIQLGIGDQSVRQIVRASYKREVPYYPQPSRLNLTLMDALAGTQATQSPDFRFIGLFLLAYILCLVPLNYFLLKRLDRKEWAWITAPVIILLFSMGAYSIGYALKGGQLYLRYCSILEGVAGEDRFAAHTLATLFSPHQGRYSLSIADPAALPEEVTDRFAPYQHAIGDLSIERERKTTIRDAMINMWDHRTFTFDSAVRLNGALEARILQFAPGRWKVQVTNRTRHALTECTLSTPDRFVFAGNLAPGETKTIDAAPQAGAGIHVQNIASGVHSTLAQIGQALALVIATNAGEAQGYAPLVFTGWFTDPVTGPRVEEEKPSVEGVNLLVVHLPPPEGLLSRLRQATPFASPSLPPPPMMSGATRRAQSAYSLNMRAYDLANAGRLDEALKTAHRALAFAPHDGTILDTVAEMYQRKKEYAKAVPYYERALRHQPGGGITETHAKYGETLLALGRKEEAIRHLMRAARDTLDPWGRKAQERLKRLGIRSEVRQN